MDNWIGMKLPRKLKLDGQQSVENNMVVIEDYLSELHTYLEAKEKAEHFRQIIVAEVGTSDTTSLPYFHNETKEPMFKAEEIELCRWGFTPENWILKGFKSWEEAEQAREALLKLTK